MSTSNEDRNLLESGPPLPPSLMTGSNIQLGTIAPALGHIGYAPEPDYLDINVKGRGVLEKMFANTGATYLMATFIGGAYGLRSGLAATPNSRFRVKVNSVLNHCGKTGSRAGNAVGVLSLMFTLYDWGLEGADLERHTGNEAVSPAIAAFLTGATYKSMAGPRVAALAGTIGAGMVGATYIGNTLSGIPFGSKGFLFF